MLDLALLSTIRSSDTPQDGLLIARTAFLLPSGPILSDCSALPDLVRSSSSLSGVNVTSASAVNHLQLLGALS